MEQRAAHSGDWRFDLAGYLSRIGFDGSPHADLASLRALHRAHLAAIPFENIDVRLGRPIRLDPASLEDKIVRRGRGGYCFEQNALFAAALRTLGFDLATLEARVRTPATPTPRPRTHMVLAVDVDGRRWLADVGFGGDGPLEPVPFDPGPSDHDAAYRLQPEPDGAVVLVRRFAEQWQDLYAFTLSPALPVDYMVANHFTSTWPDSPFVKTLTIQLTRHDVRHILRGHHYIERRGDEEQSRELSSEEVVDLVRDVFGLRLTGDEIREALTGIRS